MSFRISGLAAAPFQPLFALGDADLEARGARRQTADAPNSFPCRVTLADAAPGERLILVHHEHQPARSPYRAGGPIYVREAAVEPAVLVDAVPDYLRRRLLSLRAYDEAGMMVDGEVAEGAAVEPLIARMLGDPAVAYIHAHFARRGCYAALIERA
ncbi:MAG TPA: DUF1203 domain-containing protein [Alphaproteobacteria bacterium]|nr:DUF1203 domain-containing protein [Alphaproteobacteria bacterium]